MKYFLQISLILIFFILISFSKVPREKPKTGFWAMEGNLITHIFEEKTDSLSGPELFELQNENGIPVWFGRHIFKDVCISGECKMIRLWLFWDGAGNYLGMQIPEGEPLTKSDHTEFEPEDYIKLEDILKDTASVLKTIEQEELVVIPDSINPYEVDGYTAATQPTLAEVVVKDAVFSCYTLWHTVYGPSQNEILRILDNRANSEFLKKMLETQKDENIFWVISAIKKHPELYGEFSSEIFRIIKNENSILSAHALTIFNNKNLSDTVIQQQLINILGADDADMSIKYEILWKLIGFGEINQDNVLSMLKIFYDKKIGVGTYNLILRLVTPEHISNNQEIAEILNDLSQNENGYVRNLTKRILNESEK